MQDNVKRRERLTSGSDPTVTVSFEILGTGYDLGKRLIITEFQNVFIGKIWYSDPLENPDIELPESIAKPIFQALEAEYELEQEKMLKMLKAEVAWEESYMEQEAERKMGDQKP